MNKYNLPLYEPMKEIGETQQEIDLVNKECKNIYLGVWQGVLSLCYDLYEHQVQQGIDTTFIEDECELVWDSIYDAMGDNLLNDTDIEILGQYKLDWMTLKEQYYQDTPINEPHTNSKTVTKRTTAETDTENVTIITTTTVIKTPKCKNNTKEND